MNDDDSAAHKMEQVKLEDSNGVLDGSNVSLNDTTAQIKREDPGSATQSPNGNETLGSSRTAQRARKSSQKPASRQAPLFTEHPDKTKEACDAFQVIPDCLYGSKHMGSTDNDAFDCDCREEWGKSSIHVCTKQKQCGSWLTIAYSKRREQSMRRRL